MKYKNILKETQPVFYRMITRAFHSDRVGHAYLLIGDDTDEVALFLAQSLVCERDELACEECDDCMRIKENNYPDLIVFDGEEASIKKENINYIQSKFTRSSFEGKAQIYILKHIESSSNVAMNALLKFLEEPTSNVYAILTARNLNKVLPTIQSRCEIIHLMPESKKSIKLKLLNEKVPEEDASIISSLTDNHKNGVLMYNDDIYSYIKSLVIDFIDDLYNNPNNIIINQQIHIMKDHKGDKDAVRLYLRMLVLALRDMFHVKHSITPIFTDHQKEFNKYPEDDKILDKIEVVLDTLYYLDMNTNVSLLLDGMAYKIVKGEKYG